MKQLFLILTAAVLIAAAPNANNNVPAGQNPNASPELKLDLNDQTDTYAIPFDNSDSSQNREIQMLDKMQKQEQAKKGQAQTEQPKG